MAQAGETASHRTQRVGGRRGGRFANRPYGDICIIGASGSMDVGALRPALPLRRALRARALFQFPPEGERPEGSRAAAWLQFPSQ